MTPATPAHGRHAADRQGRHRAWRSTYWLPSRTGLVGVALLCGALIVMLVMPTTRLPDAASPAAASAAVPAEADESRRIALADVGLARGTAAPVQVRIPSVGVQSTLLQLGVDDAGVLVPPDDYARAGWFRGSPVPGDVGPSVIAGHVDSRDGPAVFFRLDELVAGDEVLVDRADGSTVRFTVTAIDRFPKDEFPTEDVYGPTPRAELRLITCGGEFDRDRRSYRDNVVVSAVRV